MAYAVTHILVAILILDLFRHYIFGKKKFPRYLLVIGGIAGLSPDLDVVLTWFLNIFTGRQYSLHGTFTHSYLFVILFLIIAAALQYWNNLTWAKIFYVIAAGWFIHLGLDWIYGDYKTLFWPFSTPFSIFPPFAISRYRASIDAVILVFWLVHEEIHHKIKDYF